MRRKLNAAEAMTDYDTKRVLNYLLTIKCDRRTDMLRGSRFATPLPPLLTIKCDRRTDMSFPTRPKHSHIAYCTNWKNWHY